MRLVLASFGAIAIAVVFAACSDGSSSPAAGGPRVDAASDAPSQPSVDADVEASVDVDAHAESTCEKTRAFVLACQGELTCGADKFDMWCAANDSAINSEAFRRAEAKCLVAPAACQPTTRRSCEYTHYGTETPTAAQQKLVEAYCATCEPGDLAGCKTRATSYDSAAGPASVTDIFVAAWELADPLCDSIREKCTGAPSDGGTDCAKAFAECSADEYLARLPDCP